jgi:hypothetical protein
MSDDKPAKPDDSDEPERRKRAAFRVLVEEMLDQIRDASRHEGVWTEDSRSAAEADLARIMEKVREEAIKGKDEED